MTENGEDRVAAFRECHLFTELDPGHLATLAQQAETVELGAGEVLFEQDDEPDAVYVILSGRLEAVRTRPDGEKLNLGTMDRGRPVGELGVLFGRPRGATLRALEDARLARLTPDTLGRVLG